MLPEDQGTDLLLQLTREDLKLVIISQNETIACQASLIAQMKNEIKSLEATVTRLRGQSLRRSLKNCKI